MFDWPIDLVKEKGTIMLAVGAQASNADVNRAEVEMSLSIGSEFMPALVTRRRADASVMLKFLASLVDISSGRLGL